MEDNSSLLRRIQKLLAIANDTRADPNEAAAAAGMAERIMRKHQIEHAEVMSVRLDRGEEELGTADTEARMKPGDKHARLPVKMPPWAQWLCFRVAKFHNCELRYAWSPERGRIMRFYGLKADAAVAAWTVDYIVSCLRVASSAFMKAAPRSKADGDSFRKGFVVAVCSKIQEQAKEREADSTMRALVVSKQAAIAKHFGDFEYTEGRETKLTSQGAAAAGAREGRKVDLNRRGVGGGEGSGQLLLG